MPDALDGARLAAALAVSGEHLALNHTILDNLNVFPVPDGDTGSNMLATYRAGLDDLAGAVTLAEIADRMSEATTRESRGNSGFILARFFRGFFDVLKEFPAISTAALADAFAAGSYQVNTSLFSPVEGTMITIIAAMATALREFEGSSVPAALEAAIGAAREALFRTPTQLKILAKAGVIDSGGLGFIHVVDGLLRGLTGVAPDLDDEDLYRFPPDPTVTGGTEQTEEMHRYCTEVLVRTADAASDGQAVANNPGTNLHEFLRSNGSSIALVREDEILKVHIHTDQPEHVVRYLGSYGAVVHTKIEDMQEQMGLIATGEDPESASTVLACVPGDGFGELLSSLGVENTLLYSTELPSTAVLMDKIDEAPGNNVIVLPNNKNILPSAMLARDRSQRNVSIVPSENVVQGLAAIYGFSENEDMKTNVRSMVECMEMAESFSVYRSVANTEFDGTTIREKDFFAVRSGHVLSVESDATNCVLAALSAAGLEDKCNACLYYGSDDSRETAEAAARSLTRSNPGLEVEILRGGQPTHYLIVSLE